MSYVVGGKTIWKSPNKKWGIDVNKNGSKFFLGYRLGDRVLEIAVSDGWSAYYCAIYENGKIQYTSDYWGEVPKYVKEKVYEILRKAYQNWKMGKKLY